MIGSQHLLIVATTSEPTSPPRMLLVVDCYRTPPLQVSVRDIIDRHAALILELPRPTAHHHGGATVMTYELECCPTSPPSAQVRNDGTPFRLANDEPVIRLKIDLHLTTLRQGTLFNLLIPARAIHSRLLAPSDAAIETPPRRCTWGSWCQDAAIVRTAPSAWPGSFSGSPQVFGSQFAFFWADPGDDLHRHVLCVLDFRPVVALSDTPQDCTGIFERGRPRTTCWRGSIPQGLYQPLADHLEGVAAMGIPAQEFWDDMLDTRAPFTLTATTIEFTRLSQDDIEDVHWLTEGGIVTRRWVKPGDDAPEEYL